MMRPMTYDDTFLALSDANLKEIRIMTSTAPQIILEALWRACDKTWAYDDDGQIKALLGIERDGTVFLFFGVVDSVPVSFYRELKDIVQWCRQTYGIVTSTILIENHFAMKLATFLGASFSKPYVMHGAKFVDFQIGR